MNQVSKYKRHHCTGLHSEHNQNNHCEIFKFKFQVGIANPKLSLISFKHHSADSSMWIITAEVKEPKRDLGPWAGMCFDVFLCLDSTWGLHWSLNSLLSVENAQMCKNVHFSQSFHCWRKNGCLAEALLTQLVFSSPFSQQHPCLSMNSVRRRVNLGHCCLPGKRVFSMRQCAIMYNG